MSVPTNVECLFYLILLKNSKSKLDFVLHTDFNRIEISHCLCRYQKLRLKPTPLTKGKWLPTFYVRRRLLHCFFCQGRPSVISLGRLTWTPAFLPALCAVCCCCSGWIVCLRRISSNQTFDRLGHLIQRIRAVQHETERRDAWEKLCTHLFVDIRNKIMANGPVPLRVVSIPDNACAA